MTSLRSSVFLRAGLVMAALLSIDSSAQTTPPPPVASKDNEILTLTPFTVSTERDTGYIAADVISAGRLSTPLLKTPSDVTILTRDFIDDLGLFDITSAANWLPNSVAALPVGGTDFGNNYTFRSIFTGKNTRNYFTNNFGQEEYITERVEGARGPNGILYGDSLVGGQMNILTKRARTYNFASLRLRVDSQGSQQAAIDVNRALSPQLALRVNAVYQDGSPDWLWKDHQWDKRKLVDVTLTYKPWKNTEVRVDAEVGRLNKSLLSYFMTDLTSSWDGTFTVAAPLTAAPAVSTGVTRLGNFYVITPSVGGGVMNWANLGRTNGTSLSLSNDGSRPASLAQFPIVGRREYAMTPPDKALTTGVRNFSIYIDQSFDSGLTLEVAAEANAVLRHGGFGFFTAINRDVNRVLPDGRANPNFGKLFSSGSLNGINESPEWGDTVRAAAAYPVKFGWGRQLISAVVSRRTHSVDFDNYFWYRTNGPNANWLAAENQVQAWRYLDEPANGIPNPVSDATYQFQKLKTRETKIYENLRSFQVNTVGNYFSDRLTLIAGIRRDEFHGEQRDFLTRDNQGGVIAYNRFSSRKPITTRSLGLVYFPIKQLGFYANAGEGFFTALFANPQLEIGTGQPESRGKNFGVRLNLLEGRLQGSVGYYNTREKNRFSASGPTNDINTIWREIGRPNDQLFNATTTTAFADSIDTRGRGWEADISANLTKQLRFKANIAFPDSIQQNAIPVTRRYVAANVTAWEAAAALPTATTALKTSLSNVKNVVAGAVEGRDLNGLFAYTANVFANYEFRGGRMNGLRVGGGVNFRGKRLIGNQNALPFAYIYDKAYSVSTATLGYSLPLSEKLKVDLQLNVTNLFDYADPTYTSVRVVNGAAYRDAYTYIVPRTYQLTATFRF